MNHKALIVLLSIFLSISSFVKADEGMWIPLLLEKYNIEDMQSKGFKLTAEDIYSINHSSMKDAVIIFGGGCTGELISDKGLIITNHHCGLSRIQSHSTVEHDYLTDGFWAMSEEEELLNPGLTATFLLRIEDVSQIVLRDTISEFKTERIDSLIKANNNDKKYKVDIKPFYFGNEYYMFVYEVFKDVRLVGAPPSSIGKFGGDTDNWMWPRHTGDFSLFRIYADKNNKPAKYDVENRPYKPLKHFPISLKGVKKNDFTMVLGYPGRTSEYIPACALESIVNVENPHRIDLRGKRLDIMNAAMDNDEQVRIQYASKYARVSNAWKKWMGVNKGVAKMNGIEIKKQEEKQFTEWLNKDDKRLNKYGTILDEYNSLYENTSPYALAMHYMEEAIFAIEAIDFVYDFTSLLNQLDTESEEAKTALKTVRGKAKGFFKDYHQTIDKQVFIEMLQAYKENIHPMLHPDIFLIINKKYKGNINAYADDVYEKSIFVEEGKMQDVLKNYGASSQKKMLKDPMFVLLESILSVFYEKIMSYNMYFETQTESLNQKYMSALQEMQSEKLFYPNANFTLRVAYGKVEGYSPDDGVEYDYFTTLAGVIEKDNPDIYDYRVPAKLKELYLSKDYGIYAEDSVMHVCFIASNHTSGGNSGSPVVNANGELIGVNFDRNWEGTMSDLMYDPAQCRNIVLDIRYALFVIDKFAGASYLIDEMTLTTNEE